MFFFKKKPDLSAIFATISATPQGAGLLISAYKSALVSTDAYKQGDNAEKVAQTISSTMYLLCYLYLNSLAQKITNKDARLLTKEHLAQTMFEPKYIEGYGFFNSASLTATVEKIQAQLGTVPIFFTGISQYSLGGAEYLENTLGSALNLREPGFTMDLIEKFLALVTPAFEDNIVALNKNYP